jgi:hypothetical protein
VRIYTLSFSHVNTDHIHRTHTRWEVILTGLMGLLWLSTTDVRSSIHPSHGSFAPVLALILSLLD